MQLIVRKKYLDELIELYGTPDIKVITGIRRSGKSVLLQEFITYLKSLNEQINIVMINLQELEFDYLLEYHALHQYIMNQYKEEMTNVLLIDEVQMCPQFELAINSIYAKGIYDIYITGSNAKLLSGELATYLAGRYVEFIVYPFSFAEFLELYHSVFPEETVQKSFQQYILYGGMPYLANIRYADEPSRQYLQDLFNSVQLKDIVKRNKIRDVDLLERIMAYVMANVGNTFSASSLAKFLKSEQRTVAPETILNYIRYCCDAYLFYQVKREEVQGRQILASNEKYYIADHGIREAMFGGNAKDINLTLENIVYLELLRRGYHVTVGKNQDKEIDFVCDKRGEKLYIQVTYLLASEETIQREFGVYDTVRDNFPKYVVSMDEFDMSRNGIKHRNIRDFLLDENWE